MDVANDLAIGAHEENQNSRANPQLSSTMRPHYVRDALAENVKVVAVIKGVALFVCHL